LSADLAALWSAAAVTLVSLMTTDTWGQAKAGLAGLWRRRHPGQAAVVEADLEAARALAAAARRAGDDEAIEDLTAEWRSRLRRAGEADEEFAAGLRLLVEDYRKLLPGRLPGQVVMIARASGGSRVNQAGRDQRVSTE
jgi:hypothetical protein